MAGHFSFKESCLDLTTYRCSLVAVATALSLLMTPARADEAALPGGATSLRESYGDWLVNCAIAGQGAQARKVCAMTQEQKASSGQRVIAMELRAAASDTLATLYLPFGLDLTAGATMQIDEGTNGKTLPFRTCLPVGCLVLSNIDAGMLTSLRNGKSLKVHAKADNGKEMVFPLSLAGFGTAFDRTLALAK